MKKLRPEYIMREVHRHNGLLGLWSHAYHGLVHSVLISSTVTPEARAIAVRIKADMEFLREELKTRVDPPSAFQPEE